MSDEILYIVVAEHSPGIYGVPTDVVAESEHEAAEKYRYGSKKGWVWVIPKGVASSWRFEGKMVSADDVERLVVRCSGPGTLCGVHGAKHPVEDDDISPGIGLNAKDEEGQAWDEEAQAGYSW